MSARTGRLLLVAGLALAPAAGMAQGHAVPRGDGGGGSHGGSSDAGSRHVSPGVQSSGSPSSSSSGGGSYVPSNAERRHPRAGTGHGSGYYPGHPGYPGYPGYPGWGWGGGWYYPGWGGYWWPYGYSGWYGGFGGYWGYPGVAGSVYYYNDDHREGGSIRVLVDPAEARVYVDGYYAGVVDDFDGLLQRLHVAPGRHEIALKLEGYKTHRMRVYVGPDATLKLNHEMQKGSGETFEDLTGGAPLPEREVRSGRYDDERARSAEAPAESVRAQAFGRLQLQVEPEDASVYVDGAFRGTAREASSLRLAVGRHRVEVVRPGYRTAENEVDVPEGDTTRLRVILERPAS